LRQTQNSIGQWGRQCNSKGQNKSSDDCGPSLETFTQMDQRQIMNKHLAWSILGQRQRISMDLRGAGV